jgi:hypothetical protein
MNNRGVELFSRPAFILIKLEQSEIEFSYNFQVYSQCWELQGTSYLWSYVAHSITIACKTISCRSITSDTYSYTPVNMVAQVFDPNRFLQFQIIVYLQISYTARR